MMLKAKLEKRHPRDPHDGWWLELNGAVDRETFQLPSAIENGVILDKMVEAHAQKLVIDLTTLEAFDSGGVQLLVMLYKQFSEQNMRIALRNPSPYLSRVLRIMQLDRLFELESDEK
ncbi:MAG: STAS domain-containing protein [Chloroflexi bacterium]|nr:STAS domain-containing protein [Chloroflexota bacterium]